MSEYESMIKQDQGRLNLSSQAQRLLEPLKYLIWLPLPTVSFLPHHPQNPPRTPQLFITPH